ncbi:hypothetical protein KC992_00570 [Candidatus Saccharibacteria bacterium]|nr:hypothetical protein [Candidatus Saccharibacteria bacterium]
MLDWLKGILPEHLHVNLSLINYTRIEKNNSDNENSNPISIDGNTLRINASTDEGRRIADAIVKKLPRNVKHNDLVLEQGSLEEFETVSKVLDDTAYKKELEIFKPMVVSSDVPILEIAILVKKAYDNGENVAPIKSQAIQRYGNRAAMICNLYSSGYFHTLIKPLFYSKEKGDIAIDTYLEIYDMIVTESPLAMFIGVGTERSSAKKQLLKKIKANKENEVGYLNIHGINETNIKLIKSLLEEDDVKSEFTDDPQFYQKGRSFKAVIFF